MRKTIVVPLILATCFGASPVLAQNSNGGVYGVIRGGVAVDSDLRFKERDTAPPATVRRNEDLKAGFNGEVGVGYQTGFVRVEGTVGYTQANIDRQRAVGSDGRTRSLNLGLSAYADIPTGSIVTPYIGGGIGASRVDARFDRLTGSPAAGSRFSDKDWGFQWHLDAGLGIRAAENTTIELGARYTQTTALEFRGASGLVGDGALADSFRPRLSSTSILAGIRQRF